MTDVLRMPQVTPAPALARPLGAACLSPTRLDRPAFLMSCPFSFATRVPNNPWMEDMTPDEREPNLHRALNQFMDVYRFLSSEAVVYLIPSPGSCRF